MTESTTLFDFIAILCFFAGLKLGVLFGKGQR